MYHEDEDNDEEIHIVAGTLREKGRGKRAVKKDRMTTAVLEGKCCWEVRDRIPKYGGEFRHFKEVKKFEKIMKIGGYQLPWDIGFIKLIDC